MQYDDTLIERVDAYIDGAGVEALDDPDVVSFVSSYRAYRTAGNDRGAYAFARAIARRVDVDAARPLDGWTVDELKAEIDRRNADRDEDAQIVPDGRKKADLIAALQADAG